MLRAGDPRLRPVDHEASDRQSVRGRRLERTNRHRTSGHPRSVCRRNSPSHIRSAAAEPAMGRRRSRTCGKRPPVTPPQGRLPSGRRESTAGLSKQGRPSMLALSKRLLGAALLIALATAVAGGSPASAQEKKPNIVFIMGDDVGWFNIGAYHQGIMSGKTPNLDKLAARGHAVHRLLRRGELHGGPGQLHHRRDSAAHGPDDRGPGRRRRRHARPRLHASPRRSRRRVTPPASSARTTWAT